MSAESKQIDLLFEKARTSEVKMDVEQVAKVITASAVLGGLAAVLTGKLKIMSMFLLGAVSIATTVVVINANSANQVEEEPSSVNGNSIVQTDYHDQSELMASNEAPIVAQHKDELTYRPDDIELMEKSQLSGIENNSEETMIFPETDINERILIQQGEGVKKLDYFNTVIHTCIADVELKLADYCGYKIENAAFEDLIDIEVDDESLKISIKKDKEKEFNKLAKNKDVRITVYMKDLTKLVVSGIGDITSADAIPSDDLELVLSGIGDINLDKVTPKNWKVKLSGVGDVTLNSSGSSSKAEISLSGAGDVNAPNLKTDKVEVRISGAGDVLVNAVEKLNASISGSGNVCAIGEAEVSSSVSGSGKVIRDCD